MSGRKIFVSYKYGDDQVRELPSGRWPHTIARDYVDVIERMLDPTDHVFKGERDGEDLSAFADETIRSKLRDRIYDSSLTIVVISPGMREVGIAERDQWIPWEVSYSLREASRHDSSGRLVTSRTNAMFGVVLPDEAGSYDYFLERRACCPSGCTINHVNRAFAILRRNMFNRKGADVSVCAAGNSIWHGAYSYIEPVRWADFTADMEGCIARAYERRDDISRYDIHKEV